MKQFIKSTLKISFIMIVVVYAIFEIEISLSDKVWLAFAKGFLSQEWNHLIISIFGVLFCALCAGVWVAALAPALQYNLEEIEKSNRELNKN